jgi:hypothetical protein
MRAAPSYAGQPKFSTALSPTLVTVDLFPRAPADVARPDFVRPRAEVETERVAQAVRDDARTVGIAGERIPRRGRARCRVDADDRAVQRGRIAGGEDVLRAQRAAFVRRIAENRRRAGDVPVIDEVEARPVATGSVKEAVRPELQMSDRVAGKLLRPILNENRFAGGDIAAGSQPR